MDSVRNAGTLIPCQRTTMLRVHKTQTPSGIRLPYPRGSLLRAAVRCLNAWSWR